MAQIVSFAVKNRKVIIAAVAALGALIFDRANNVANAKKAEADAK